MKTQTQPSFQDQCNGRLLRMRDAMRAIDIAIMRLDDSLITFRLHMLHMSEGK